MFGGNRERFRKAHAGSSGAQTENSDTAVLVQGLNEFALELYARLRRRPGNLFFSPCSISAALATTCAGARAATAAELAALLRSRLEPARFHAAFAELLAAILGADQPGRPRIHLANALWAQKGTAFLEDFLTAIRSHYRAEASAVDFQGAPEQAAGAINSRVEKQTAGKIRSIVSPADFDRLTRLILASAIYFKGDWASPFEEEATQQGDFWIAPKQKVRVPLMNQVDEFLYMENADLQGLALPYAGREFSMVALLPRKLDGLGDLEESLTAEKLGIWLSKLRRETVNVTLPRFQLSRSCRLNQPLSEMGVRQAFDPNAADFSGMTGGRDFFLSLMAHEALVEVDERGTEAAAVTYAALAAAAPFEEPRIFHFRADHPFVFAILHKPSGAILFLGRLTNPTE